MTLSQNGNEFTRDSTEFDRSLGFIDAIFGFSATLLVTSLDVPPAEEWRSLSALLGGGLGHQLLVFAISFAVIAGLWRTNHQVISSFRALDPATLRILLYLVPLVIFIPFTTRANGDPDPARFPLPTALYAANIAAVVLITLALVLAGRRRGLTYERTAPAGQIAGLTAVAAVFLVSIPVAYRFGPINAQRCWLSLLIVGPLVVRISQRFSTTRKRSVPASPPR